ncbi:MAG TPA: hypothetical protein VLT35_02165 [Methanocella sp.]|nr:hypothetical protein [Methanocella sp.]
MYEDDMEPTMPAYYEYVAGEMQKPEYRRIKIGLDRMERIVLRIAAGQGFTSRGQALAELDEVLRKLQEIEAQAEHVKDSLVWEHILDRIDVITAIRRHLVAEIRWEVQSNQNTQVYA